MKVSGINNFSSINKNSNIKSQNFNGLWLKTSVRTDFDCVLCIPQTTVIRYYSPFSDETSEQVQSVIDKRKNANIFKDERGNTRYIVNDCKLCKRLPFNEQQYEAYMILKNNPKNNRAIEEIHNIVQNRYTNDTLNKYQIPAYNPHFNGNSFENFA